MLNATFAAPDLTTFCRLDELGLGAVGQEVTPDEAVLVCRVVHADDWCRRYGSQGIARGHGDSTVGTRTAGLASHDAADPARFDGVRVIGVDEHVWRHTRRGDKYVTVIIDLTPIRDGTGPSRLLDMVEGRSKAVFKTWLTDRPATGLAGRHRGGRDGPPHAGGTPRIHRLHDRCCGRSFPAVVAVMDPFHVVRLAGDALDGCRRRIQQAACGHRGRKGDPLYSARRTLHTGADLLTEKQQTRLTELFAGDIHVEVEAT